MRVLGRVERFDGRLQVQVRALEPTEDDPASLAPALRRDADELEGFLEFLAGEIAHPGLAATVGTILSTPEVRDGMRALPAAGADGHHGYAGGLLEHTVGVATLCRETAQLHPRLRADLLLAAALLHDVGRVRELGRGPAFRPPGGCACSATSSSACGSSTSTPGRSTPRYGPSCSTRSRRTTTARGAHRRGSRAVPREPARRPGRDPPRRRRLSPSPGGGCPRAPRGASPGVPVTSSEVSRPAARMSSPCSSVSQAVGLVGVADLGRSSAATHRPGSPTSCPPPVRGPRGRRASRRSTAAWRSGRWGSSRPSRR